MSALDGQIWMKLVKFGTDLQKDQWLGQWFDQQMDVQRLLYGFLNVTDRRTTDYRTS